MYICIYIYIYICFCLFEPRRGTRSASAGGAPGARPSSSCECSAGPTAVAPPARKSWEPAIRGKAGTQRDSTLETNQQMDLQRMTSPPLLGRLHQGGRRSDVVPGSPAAGKELLLRHTRATTASTTREGAEEGVLRKNI